MKILVRSMTTAGEPLPDGRQIQGNDYFEIVSIMRSQTPFTNSKPLLDYMADILQKVEGSAFKPLPVNAQSATSEFLSRLATRGLVEFLPDESKTRFPERFFQVMEAIRRSGMTNMLDRKFVGQIAQEMGFDEIADWIKVNRREYSEFILGGRCRFLNDDACIDVPVTGSLVTDDKKKKIGKSEPTSQPETNQPNNRSKATCADKSE